jgi:hypothetical protein
MSAAHRQTPRFRVEDWVSFPYGSRRVWAQIIEDRGSIGVKRRRLYRVRICDEQTEEVTFEVPEDELEPVESDRGKMIEYLKSGGLVSMLRSNLGGGRDQPKVWLSFDKYGNLTHTFVPERGFVGGSTVPFFALQGNQIFTPKANEVVDFLSGFGLSPAEAESVLQSVGKLP